VFRVYTALLLSTKRGELHCWHSWSEQAVSVRRLADYRFEWVLPGHGQRVRLPAAEMRGEVLRLAESMGR
jgi:hypothetical protein